jgi:hypothetical protein
MQLSLFIFNNPAKTLETALLERKYFSYTLAMSPHTSPLCHLRIQIAMIMQNMHFMSNAFRTLLKHEVTKFINIG